jgi:hypothetical protein
VSGTGGALRGQKASGLLPPLRGVTEDLPSTVLSFFEFHFVKLGIFFGKAVVRGETSPRKVIVEFVLVK